MEWTQLAWRRSCLIGIVCLFDHSAWAQVTQRVSVDSGGAQGNGQSSGAAISADGRFVAFSSTASDLVGGDTNANLDVFVRDRLAGTTECVSVDSSGAQGNGQSFVPSISFDGRYVAFQSLATNLVAGDTNGTWDVFIRDRQTGTTERVSVDSGATQGNGGSYCTGSSISSDGRYVAFYSEASNLVGGDTNASLDVFVRDRLAGTTERVSVDAGGAQGNNSSYGSSISSDGRYVAFYSLASNLVAGDTNGFYDVFVRDRLGVTTERISLDSSGTQANGNSSGPSISADGRRVAFQSEASNLVSGDANFFEDIFVRDRFTSTTEKVSVSSGEVGGNDNSNGPSISGNGRYVTFQSFATNLVGGDTNGSYDLFLRDRLAGTTERVSVDTGGGQGNGHSYGADGLLSADGRYVAFQSIASNLVGGDTNGTDDIFVRDRHADTTTVPVSVDSLNVQGNDLSNQSWISGDGHSVAFESHASNLVSGDTNGAWDIFVRKLQTKQTIRVSVDSFGGQGNGDSRNPSICGDGHLVTFDSLASNLVPGDTNGTRDVFGYDVLTSQSTRVSVDSSGAQSDGDSNQAVISANGRYVAFTSTADNLVPGDTNGVADVFVHDLQTGQTIRVSVDSSSAQGNGDSGVASLTADGRYVAFRSIATNLVPGDTNGTEDIFLHDIQTGQTILVSVDSNGLQGDGPSEDPSISADGHYVAFWGAATNLVPGDTNGHHDVFLRSLLTNTTTRISVDSAGNQGDQASVYPSLSADGRFIAFLSASTNLVPVDTNGSQDMFLHDRQTGQTTRISVSASGVEADGMSNAVPSISADGRFVSFASVADNLVSTDTNGVEDVFVRDLYATAFTSLCDPGVDGVIACPCANPPSGSGRGCDNSAATGGAVLAASGVSYLSTDSLIFTTSGETPTALSIVLQGASFAGSGFVYGQGVRCVGGSLTRLFTKTASGGSITAPDFGAGDPTVSASSAAAGDLIQPGQSRWYFVYYRDRAGCPRNQFLATQIHGFNATQTGQITWSP